MKGIAYLIQSFLILLWWIIILWHDGYFDLFQYEEVSQTAFKALMVPDVILIAGLSLLRAYKDSRNLELIILGAFAFITFYCLQLSMASKSGLLPTLVMTLGLCYNVFLVYNSSFFKESRTENVYINFLKTFIQIVIVWGITLIIIPGIIVTSFGYTIEDTACPNFFGFILLITASALGIWSAITMVKYGNGTPLPINQTQALVISGPYRYVRNPMAMAGILQGISVSILLQSLPVFVYALLGAVLWNYVVRPLEEANLESRFGEEFLQYKKEVNCWIPKIK